MAWLRGLQRDYMTNSKMIMLPVSIGYTLTYLVAYLVKYHQVRNGVQEFPVHSIMPIMMMV